jgi:hypothetical protein
VYTMYMIIKSFCRQYLRTGQSSKHISSTLVDQKDWLLPPRSFIMLYVMILRNNWKGLRVSPDVLLRSESAYPLNFAHMAGLVADVRLLRFFTLHSRCPSTSAFFIVANGIDPIYDYKMNFIVEEILTVLGSALCIWVTPNLS